jgi:Tol biopolymer transport system component
MSRQGTTEVALMSLTGDPTPVSFLNTPYPNYGGQLSPDGHWLAYVSVESGRPEIYVTTFPQAKGKWQVYSAGVHTPRWRHDGRELFFSRSDGTLMAAEVVPGKDSFVVGSVKQLSVRRMIQSASLNAPYDISPDGQRIVMSAIKAEAVHAPLSLVTNWMSNLSK